MKNIWISVLIIASVFSLCSYVFAEAEGDNQELNAELKDLKNRVAQLENQQVNQKEAGPSPKVDLSNALSKLKIKGRWAGGYFDSGEAGSYRAGSFEMPDAKIQFSFQPDDINTVVLRFNVNNATAQSPLMDYLYLQSKDFLPCLKDTPFSLTGKLGRFKLPFGEETISNNLVDGVLPSTSAANTGGNDEGLEFSGKIKLDNMKLNPLGWALSVTDGNSGVGSDISSGKAFMGKLYYTLVDPLYLSGSYYDSGSLKASSAEMSVAGLTTPPAGASNWERKIWELFFRYDLDKGKKPLDPMVFCDSKAIIRASYGAFHDITSSAQEREGGFAFIEGTYNLMPKFYVAGRSSVIKLAHGLTASLNNVTANKYERNSLGAGYRWSENTVLKLSYDWNRESGTGVEDAKNNLVSAVVASQF